MKCDAAAVPFSNPSFSYSLLILTPKMEKLIPLTGGSIDTCLDRDEQMAKYTARVRGRKGASSEEETVPHTADCRRSVTISVPLPQPSPSPLSG